MLVNPRLNIFNEMGSVILEIEDEDTVLKVDITEKVLEVIDEINNG
ncbi:hypothetical protein IEN91_05165 [Bacillus velezensis]|nr:hypothetical protein [Bacillus velezensis]QPK89829.1 hypothetical protein IEN91_05165 [Bacillus velezensis]